MKLSIFWVILQSCKARHTAIKCNPISTDICTSNLKVYILYSIPWEVSIKLSIFTLFFFKVRKYPLKRTALTKIYFSLLISLSPKLIMGNHKFHILDKDYRDKILSRNKNTERISKELGTSHCCFWLRGCYCSVKCF